MSTVTRIVAVLALAATCSGATYLYMAHVFGQERAAFDSNMEAFSTRSRTMIRQLRQARSEAAELSGWREFIQMQGELNAIHREINQLNFGNALGSLEVLRGELAGGELAARLGDRSDDLLGLLDRCAASLRAKQERNARAALMELNERAFEILAGPPSAPADGDAESGAAESMGTAAAAGEGDAEPDPDQAAAGG